MNDESLHALAAEIERQNAAFKDAKDMLSALGDAALDVPHAFLEELDELAASPSRSAYVMPITGLRA